MLIKVTKRSISSPMTTTDGCVAAKDRAEFTIKQSASLSAFLHAMFNEENLFIRMEMSRSLFFGLTTNFSCETVGIIVSSNITSLDICFRIRLARSEHLVSPIISFSGYLSKMTRAVDLYFVRTYVT
ncbi:hypothetical protein AVEN_64857-1 [Araneus ventricosus]|uniref:Uncharacterized protein n=1 Tax=Araneus ventricosus TaxID=182803 RepID=A0A4Y2GKQ6_ARAVE|nr:hypothetical protein AVEN_64857-1 [Araneus ventricosus]